MMILHFTDLSQINQGRVLIKIVDLTPSQCQQPTCHFINFNNLINFYINHFLYLVRAVVPNPWGPHPRHHQMLQIFRSKILNSSKRVLVLHISVTLLKCCDFNKQRKENVKQYIWQLKSRVSLALLLSGLLLETVVNLHWIPY